jgi:hypothetical protein
VHLFDAEEYLRGAQAQKNKCHAGPRNMRPVSERARAKSPSHYNIGDDEVRACITARTDRWTFELFSALIVHHTQPP